MQHFSHAHYKPLERLCIVVLEHLKNILSVHHRVYSLAFVEFTLHFKKLFAHRLTANFKHDPEILTLIQVIKHFAEVLNTRMVLILLVEDTSIFKELTVHLNFTVPRLQVWIR